MSKHRDTSYKKIATGKLWNFLIVLLLSSIFQLEKSCEITNLSQGQNIFREVFLLSRLKTGCRESVNLLRVNTEMFVYCIYIFQKVDNQVFVPILAMRKLRLREIKELACSS